MPSFSIEVEGEVNPLTAQEIYRVLSSCTGANASQQSLQVAVQQLQNWETTPGFYSLLQDVYADFSLPEEVRFQAILQLKNGVDKRWRKTATNAISKTEKQKIRSQAISTGIHEPVNKLAVQNALMIGKIVRYDFPHDWPNAFSTIIDHLRSAIDAGKEPHFTSNLLIITLTLVKEMVSGTLQRTRKSLQSVASELLNVLGQVYLHSIQKWSSSTTNHGADMLNSYTALKVIRRLLITGFEAPHREPLVQQTWDLVQKHHEDIWSVWKTQSQQSSKTDSDLLMKHMFQYVKLYLDMARTHAASFVSLGCMQILTRSWSIISGPDAKAATATDVDWAVHRSGDLVEADSPIEKLILKALLLFRACIRMVFNPVLTFRYQQPQDKEDKKTAIDQVRSTVFTDSFVVQLMEITVTQYFVLRPQDLRNWEEEPDEWERREEEIADAWEFSIRACSEKLFLDLLINHKELLVPKLLQVFQQYATVDNHDVLLKDSLYSAIGIAAACIEDVYDFNKLIRDVLIPEVQLQAPGYNLLRRRTAILLGQWTPIKPESLDRPAIYQIFTHLLQPEQELNDHVVRVSAGRQLRLVLEPFEFKYEDFEPYATPILSSIMNLITETELTETRMALLETVRVAVTKLEDKATPYASGIMSVLPVLWADSGEEYMMKQAILTTISAIITSLGEKGVSYHVPIMTFIHESIRSDAGVSVYLLEEALDLWSAVLQQTPTSDPDPSPELLFLLPDVLHLLDLGSEFTRQCFELVDAYAVLAPASVLDAAFLTPLMTSLKGLLEMLSSSRARDASQGPQVINNIAATIYAPTFFPDEQTRAHAARHLISTMAETGYLAELFKILEQAYDYHRDPQSNRRPPDIIGVGETSLFSLLSRLALLDASAFVDALTASNASLEWLVPEWLSNFDSIGDAIQKKLQTLGLTNLIIATNPTPTILFRSLEPLMSIWTDIMTELADGAADENEGDYLWSGSSEQGGLPDWPGEPPQDRRKRAVTNGDPTYTVNVRHFVAERLQHMIAQCGGPAAFENEWLSKVDSTVLKAFIDLKVL